MKVFAAGMFAFISLLTVSANASETIIDLVRKCKAANSEKADSVVNSVYCAGYLGGMHEMHMWYILANGGVNEDKAQFYCAPENGLQNEQLMKIFIKWSDEHPDKLHEPAGLGFAKAMRDAFPCKPI